jgi:hypothetical protein
MANQQQVIRTAMADALHNCVVTHRTRKLDDVGRRVIRQILTAEARGTGVKFNVRPPVNRPKLVLKKQPAETAVVGNPSQMGMAA